MTNGKKGGAMHPLAIDARGVEKVYGKGAVAHHALRGVDFSARSGEFVMLAGPSGSGKTTLLSILGCVLTASAGQVRLMGREITALRESRLPDVRLDLIGFIFQGSNLIRSLSAADNVALPMRLRGYSARRADREARDLLVGVGLAQEVERRPDSLSGGQRQRVAVARALAGAPPIILADEPTASLDAKSGLNVTTLLRKLAKEQGRTVVVVTHDSRIFHLADRMVHIEDGVIASEEEVEAMRASLAPQTWIEQGVAS